MADYVVVLDANVLYGIEVTDLLATLATRRVFRPHWSPQILDEVRRNLAARPDLDTGAIDRRIGHLNRALPAALVEVPPGLVEAMPINDKDRHVLALAVHAGAPTRHTAITAVGRLAGYPVAQAFAGHAPPSVTGRYLHATLAEVAAAVGALTGEAHPLADARNRFAGTVGSSACSRR